MGARGKIVVRVAMSGRAGIDGSGGDSWGKLLGICPVWESARSWFSCWRLKKSTSRDVDVDLFREEGRTRRRDLCRQVLQESMLPSTVCLATCDAVVYFLVGGGGFVGSLRVLWSFVTLCWLCVAAVSSTLLLYSL
ncbi:hypothetical protein Taro_042536 [Colocasia esculenta]|uniref:Uncharacterized protein n=1 Tax=Colocasia esculenta TaxID=4460 RepID=A0A843WIP1_COLES|nr:hypothetical protein [Colocasia esculenta]